MASSNVLRMNAVDGCRTLYYDKPWCRCGPFLVGLALAFAFTSWQTPSGHLPPLNAFKLTLGYVVFFGIGHASQKLVCFPAARLRNLLLLTLLAAAPVGVCIMISLYQ